MIDERAELERAIERFRPEPGIVERVYERRRRDQRNARITATIVGVIVFAVAVGVAAVAFRARSVPANEPPPAITMHNGPIDVVGFTDGVRAFNGKHGLGSYAVKCGGSCTETYAAAWTKDGTRLAFVPGCGGGCGSAGDPYHGIRVVDIEQGTDRLILPSEGVFALAWSPDGSRIAYVTVTDYQPDTRTFQPDGGIWVINADGSGAERLTQATAPDSVSWAPDGSRLVYGTEGGVFVVGLDGSAPIPIAHGHLPTWSPDGQTIAYMAGCDVRSVTPDGLNDRSLVDLRTVRPKRQGCGGAGGLTWSPDGTKLVVLASRGPADPNVPSRQDLFELRADGSGARLVPGLLDRFGVQGLTWQPVP